jgi:hypothetical protein
VKNWIISKLKPYHLKPDPNEYTTSSGDTFRLGETVIVPSGTTMIRCFDGYFDSAHKDTVVYIEKFSGDGWFRVIPLWSGMSYTVHSCYLRKDKKSGIDDELMEFLMQ